ncbi:DinB family protein [Flavobacterium sp.]|uniref:DinB family protein n=1 Tax=Flavobacterium sp. TaxID=239 RepID=UPI0040486FDA
METTFEIWKTSRETYLNFLEKYSLEQLNKIPEGFSNNLIWNVAHVLVSQQKLVYALSELPFNVSQELVEKYQNGTKPEGFVSSEELAEIKDLLLSTIVKTELDYSEGVFKTFNSYQTKTGFYIANLQNAFEFNNYHEGIHLGVMFQIKKFL